MKRRDKSAAYVLSLLAAASAVGLVLGATADDPGDDSTLSAAICPLVYRLDESPSARGYRYSFFGNGFFINDQGYLLTVAHVLETFKNGGQPSLLVTRSNRPPQLVPLNVVASDSQHDVAVLRTSPNPFSSHYRVTFLSLSSTPAVPGQSVLALSLHPARPQNAGSFQLPIEDRSAGTVLSFEKTQLEKFAPAADVFLLSHPVTLGQSGSPVLAADSHAVIGLVEGRWVRNGSIPIAGAKGQSTTEPPGAAIPIRYAVSLLQQNGIAYHFLPSSPGSGDPPAKH